VSSEDLAARGRQDAGLRPDTCRALEGSAVPFPPSLQCRRGRSVGRCAPRPPSGTAPPLFFRCAENHCSRFGGIRGASNAFSCAIRVAARCLGLIARNGRRKDNRLFNLFFSRPLLQLPRKRGRHQCSEYGASSTLAPRHRMARESVIGRTFQEISPWFRHMVLCSNNVRVPAVLRSARRDFLSKRLPFAACLPRPRGTNQLPPMPPCSYIDFPSNLRRGRACAGVSDLPVLGAEVASSLHRPRPPPRGAARIALLL